MPFCWGRRSALPKRLLREAGAKNVRVITTEDYATQNAENILGSIKGVL